MNFESVFKHTHVVIVYFVPCGAGAGEGVFSFQLKTQYNGERVIYPQHHHLSGYFTIAKIKSNQTAYSFLTAAVLFKGLFPLQAKPRPHLFIMRLPLPLLPTPSLNTFIHASQLHGEARPELL